MHHSIRNGNTVAGRKYLGSDLFMMAVPNKWENVCRLCSEEKNEMLSIFGNEGMQRKVAQKLRACLPVLVYKTDPLPKQICQFCAARLDDIYEFREYCLSVYKSMHIQLLRLKHIESVQIFLDAMKNSPDPCQAQLWREKARAPPPLVPLPASLPVESPLTPTDIDQDHPNSSIETLPELPCEVEINEMNTEPILGSDVILYESSTNTKNNGSEEYNRNIKLNDNVISLHDSRDNSDDSMLENLIQKEEKRTSILEQVLMGSLTMNDRKDIDAKTKLTSQWWCAPCNSYYKTKESLMKHMQLHCPRKYTCRKCSMCFELVEELAKHEATSHLKITLDFDENVKECEECDRQFVSWEMLKQHRLRDHFSEAVEIGINTWCAVCNRFFPTIEAFRSHSQLHEASNYSLAQASQLVQTVDTRNPAIEQPLMEINKEHFFENTKSLTCPTCGKTCTQQSALSNHMRTHEPKRHKCDICGRSFGLFIRLAAHRMSEHNQQTMMSSIPANAKHEAILNAEREAREARNRPSKTRTCTEMLEREDIPNHDEPPTKRNATLNTNPFKYVARCGICLQWFSDHTTMLTHLQTHSDNYTCKNFICHICNKSFKEKWQLFRHEMSHKRNETLSTYTCTVCNKSFVDKSAYKTHQKTHIVDKTYHCSKCNKIFFKEVSLLTHQCTTVGLCSNKAVPSKSVQKSSNGKRYRCSKCNASFNSPQLRNSHMKVHMEGTHTVVRKHDMKVESEEEAMPKLSPETSLEYTISPIEPKVEINEETTPPPIKRTLIRTAGGYRCGVCQSPFVLRELAVAHLRSAHPVMPYQCPYCKKRFTTQYTFTHHIKTDHPDEHEN